MSATPPPAIVVETAGAPPSRAGTPKILLALAVLAAGWFVLYGLNQLQEIAGPLLLVANLMIIAYPVQAWLDRRGVPRAVGAVASAVIVFAILLAFVFALVWSVLQMVQILPDYQDQFLALYASLVEQLGRWGITETQVLDQLRTISPSRIAGWVGTALSSVTSAVTWLAIVATIVFVVIIDSLSLPERFVAARRSNGSVARSLGSFSQGVRRYWVVSSVFGLIVAVIDTIMLAVLDVPLAGVWGVLAFLTNFIPNIGFVIGVIPPALMALLAVDARTAILVVVLYSVVNFTIQSIIQPKFSGEAVGVTATVSLLSLMLWTWVLGPLGALLALPATLLAKSLLIDPDPQLLWLNAYIAADPDDVDAPPPPQVELAPQPRPLPLRPPSSTTGRPRTEAAWSRLLPGCEPLATGVRGNRLRAGPNRGSPGARCPAARTLTGHPRRGFAPTVRHVYLTVGTKPPHGRMVRVPARRVRAAIPHRRFKPTPPRNAGRTRCSLAANG